MRRWIRRLWRIIVSAIGFGVWTTEPTSSTTAPDEVRRQREFLKTCAAQAVACQYRIEKRLAEERAALESLEEDIRGAVMRQDDDSARRLIVRRDSCQARIQDLESQLDHARREVSEATRRVQLFQEQTRSGHDETKPPERNSQPRIDTARNDSESDIR